MLLWVNYILENNDDLEIKIKPHPSMSIKKLQNFKKYNFARNGKCQIIDDNIYSILKKQILISSGPTGVSFESLIYGCTLFYLILDPSDLLMLKDSNKNRYVLIKSELELLKQIKKWKHKKIVKENNKIKSLFFTKINNNNLKIFY